MDKKASKIIIYIVIAITLIAIVFVGIKMLQNKKGTEMNKPQSIPVIHDEKDSKPATSTSGAAQSDPLGEE